MDGGVMWAEIWRDDVKVIERQVTDQLDADGLPIVEERITYANGNEDAIRTAARQALAVNRTFLDLASPTNAQTLAQVKHLTRVANGLLRIELADFASAD
jgi:hypothetical protein